jgi:putative ABC transport system permease protein
MFPLLRSLTFRYLRQKWDRALLVSLSIALGVATLVSARLLNECVEQAAMDTTVPADVADLYVANGDIGVDWAVVEDLKEADLPGVRRVEPFVFDRITMPELGDKAATLFGTDLSGRSTDDLKAGEKLNVRFTPVVNSLVLAGRPVALSRRLYEDRKTRGKADTEPVEIRYTNRTERFNLIAVIDVAKDSPIAPFADSLVAIELERAAKLVRLPGAAGETSAGRVTRVNLFLDSKAALPAVQERVREIVRGRAAVRTPEENRKSTEQVIGGIKIVLNLSSLGALVVGLFLVYNALSVTVTERRHDIGVMRSLGATRGQIARLFTVEAMILGALGALPGIPLGIWLADVAIAQFGEEINSVFRNGDIRRPELSWLTAVVAVVAGMITALLAALIPALSAASDEPAEAVRRVVSSKSRVLRRIHRGACIGLVLAGLVTFAIRKELPSRTGSMFGMFSILVGLFLAMPILVRYLARMLLPVLRTFMGVEFRLAADNLIRSPARTGVVIGAMAAGVSMMFQTAGVGKSNQIPIREWLDQVLRADAYVFRGNLASANSSLTPMEPGVRDELKAIPGVERVVGLRFYRPEYEGTFILVVGIDADDYHRGVRARLPEGLPKLDMFEKLPGGNSVVVSDNFALKWKKKVGDEITIPGPRGPVTLTIIGVGQDYSWSQGTVFLDRAKYSELFNDAFVDAYHVFFDLNADHDPTFRRVQDFATDRQMLVQNRESVNIYLGGVIDRLFRVAYLQQVIVAIVATLGVVTALLISVLQRRRELGLLRAVGATQPQVMKSVLAEAMLMGVLGTLLGFALGLPLEWYLLDVVLKEESGFIFEMRIPWVEAAGIGLISILTATLAGLIPAVHAVRLRIPDAIAYE